MNPETAEEDVREARAGTHVVYEKKLGLENPGKKRDDVTYYPVPFAELVVKITAAPEHAKLRKLIVNMVYVGVVADLMGIDPAESEKAIAKQLKGKKKAIDLNVSAVKLGLEYAAANFPTKIPYRVERMDATRGKIIVEGNAAAALGCVFAGATVCAWYPITPSSSLAVFIDSSASRAAAWRFFALAQGGCRAFTSTSGPGISLMSEIIGLGYYTEIPAVLFDVQRVGPSTDIPPTRTMQGDVLLCYFNSHGDAKHPVLFPASPEECFSMAGEAFDLAERLQTPVFVLTDLDLGMNNWMSDPFPYPTAPLDRGKVLDEAAIEKVKGTWGRYKDVDGDAIPYRTLPGTNHPAGAFFTRGSGHNEMAQYSEKARDYVNNVDRLARKFDTARTFVPKPEIQDRPGAVAGVLAYGTSHYGTAEGRDRLAADFGVPLDYCRLRALPIGP